MTCDWLLETRTALWEYEQSQNVSDIYIPVSGSVMSKFQKDLNSLRSVTEEIPVSNSEPKKKSKKINKQKILQNATPRVYLYEAVYRIMAGASPGQTQQLLERSQADRDFKTSSIICSKNSKKFYLILNLMK